MSRLLRGATAQLLLITVLPLTLFLAIISFGSLTMHQQAMRELVVERDIRAVKAAASSIGVILQHKIDVLGLVAESAARGARITDTLAINPELLREFPDGIALYAEDGSLIMHSELASQWADAGFTLAARDAHINVHQGALVLGNQDITRRIVAVGMLSAQTLGFDALINPSNDPTSISAFLFGADGRALAHTSPDQVNADVRNHPGVAEALQGEHGGVVRPDHASGEEHVVSYAPIVTNQGATGLGVIIEEPWETVLDPLMRYSLATPLITLPVLLLAMLAVMFGLRRIVQPLQQLDQQAREIGQGTYVALSEPVRGIQEIEQLQTTLRIMSAQIQADQKRLRNYARAVTETQEAERKRLARELHDDTIQNLIVLSQRIQVMRQTDLHEQPQMASRLDDMRSMVLRMIEDVRRFSRALRPIYLEDAGLAAALERLAYEANETAQQHPAGAPAYAVSFRVSDEIARMKPEVELALYRIAQEALANALRHATPTAISIALSALPSGGVSLVIEDDGQGFVEIDATLNEGSRSGGFGLIGIRERALLIGASVNVRSEAGKGTRITIHYREAD